jgi:hypothetical protein
MRELLLRMQLILNVEVCRLIPTLGVTLYPMLTQSFFTQGCNTSYHANYSVTGGVRNYYAGVPEVVQVGEHQYIERKVVEMFVNLMLISWYVCAWCSSTVSCSDYIIGHLQQTVLEFIMNP